MSVGCFQDFSAFSGKEQLLQVPTEDVRRNCGCKMRKPIHKTCAACKVLGVDAPLQTRRDCGA